MPTVYIGNWQNSGGNTSTWPGFGEIPPDYGQNLENPPLKTRDLHDHFRADNLITIIGDIRSFAM
jgi:hypothetical protein